MLEVGFDRGHLSVVEYLASMLEHLASKLEYLASKLEYLASRLVGALEYKGVIRVPNCEYSYSGVARVPLKGVGVLYEKRKG